MSAGGRDGIGASEDDERAARARAAAEVLRRVREQARALEETEKLAKLLVRVREIIEAFDRGELITAEGLERLRELHRLTVEDMATVRRLERLLGAQTGKDITLGA